MILNSFLLCQQGFFTIFALRRKLDKFVHFAPEEMASWRKGKVTARKRNKYGYAPVLSYTCLFKLQIY